MNFGGAALLANYPLGGHPRHYPSPACRALRNDPSVVVPRLRFLLRVDRLADRDQPAPVLAGMPLSLATAEPQHPMVPNNGTTVSFASRGRVVQGRDGGREPRWAHTHAEAHSASIGRASWPPGYTCAGCIMLSYVGRVRAMLLQHVAFRAEQTDLPTLCRPRLHIRRCGRRRFAASRRLCVRANARAWVCACCVRASVRACVSTSARACARACACVSVCASHYKSSCRWWACLAKPAPDARGFLCAARRTR